MHKVDGIGEVLEIGHMARAVRVSTKYAVVGSFGGIKSVVLAVRVSCVLSCHFLFIVFFDYFNWEFT